MNEPGASRKKMPPGLEVRLQAAETLKKVLAGESFYPLTPKDMAEGRDRALVNRLVTVALRRHGHLNQIIKALLSRGMPARSGSFEAHMRLGLSQLLFMPGQASHSALHLAVEALRHDRRGARLDRLLNATLRQAQREETKWRGLDNALLFPGWLRKAWEANYGEAAFTRFGEALLAGAALDLSLADDDPALITALGGKRLLGDTLRLEKRDRRVADLAFYDEGRWWVQDVAAGIPARLFTLAPGGRILDMCAAPGGKSAQLVKAGYKVSALDIDHNRLQRVSQNLLRLNMSAELINGDATLFRAPEKFGGILLDAPCSSTGTFRRHPETIWQRSASDIEGRVKLQRLMIANAVENLRGGGQLIYCTCSLQEEEGEGQARWILQEFPQLRLLALSAKEMAEKGLGGLDDGVIAQGFLRTHPGTMWRAEGESEPSVLGMDGFFAARFVLDGI